MKMSRMLWRGLMVALCVPAVVGAQGSTGLNPVYRKAQAMVNDGNAAAGRALVDSMVSVAPAGSNEYAEAIYWRAVLGATAVEAEMDYRRILVDYPLSPRVEDALIRLAQLELARANYDGALRHLNRLALEHPESPARGRAGFWTARALFEKNDIQGGCIATADALARTNENDAELRNQITYLNQRCVGVVLAGTLSPSATSPVAKDSTAVAVQETVVSVPSEVPPATIDSVLASKPIISSVVVSGQPAVKPSMKPPVKPRDAEPTMVEPVIPTPRASSVTPATSAASGAGYTVQVAAYNVRSQAEAMAAKLRDRGYESRVAGTGAPFRVRIGRYATHAQATAVQRSLKAKQIAGFVVQAERR